MKYLSFPRYISINGPGCSYCFFTGIGLNLSRPSLSSDSGKWNGYLCTSRVNRRGKTPEICLTVWALGPFNLVVLGLLPATLYVCILNGAQLLLNSQEESSLQSKKKKKKTSSWRHPWGNSHLFGGSLPLHVEVIYTAAPATLPSPPPHHAQKWSNGKRSKLRVNCFIVAAQQINKHLEAFRAAH